VPAPRTSRVRPRPRATSLGTCRDTRPRSARRIDWPRHAPSVAPSSSAEWHLPRGADLLERVPLLDKRLDDYTDVVEPGALERIHLERSLDNALQVEGDWDYVVMHDPQPAAMHEYVRSQGVAPADTKWIWRCHIDLTDANPRVFEFFRPFIEQYDASVWTMPQ